MSIEEIDSRPFVGGGPLNGREWVFWTDSSAGFLHVHSGERLDHEDLASMDCYDPVVEDGRWVFRYNRAKGEARGYRDRDPNERSHPTDGLSPGLIEKLKRQL